MRILLFFLCLAATAAHAAPRAGAAWHMPEAADMCSLSWVNGPPVVQGWRPDDKHYANFRDDRSLLAFRSGRWGMLLDPRKIKIDRLTFGDARSAADLEAILSGWGASSLTLEAVTGGKTYRPAGGPVDDRNPATMPVRIVESGDWFQHVAIYDLELRDESGARLPARSRLEIRAWGDRCLFEWHVQPEGDGPPPDLTASLEAKGRPGLQTATAAGGSVQLGVRFTGSGLEPAGEKRGGIAISGTSLDDFTAGEPSATYSPTTDAWEIRIPKQRGWPLDQGPQDDIPLYLPELLDRISRFTLRLENTSDQPRDLRLRFVHDYHPISGYVPMMLRASGEQTGLPLQSSKNWHVRPESPLPYDNAWIKISTRLRLEPKSTVDLRYDMVHAMWHGAPASSAAQLSLIGWGFNGFWTQMALGSWGETLCLQPGRTMRRSFITDLRPFMILGPSGLSYDWTPNFGGGDIAKATDESGRVLMWQDSVTTYPMIGPDLSRVRVTERSEDGALQLTIDTMLPRSNSATRGYFKVRLEALRDTNLRDLALFQLGSDYYNEVNASTIAWGEGGTKAGAENPPGAEWGRVFGPAALPGTAPWIALCGTTKDGDTPTSPVRGLIVRDYRAVLGGREERTPHFAAARTRGALNAELVLPPDDLKLQRGDTVEFLAELVIFPPSEQSYYGPSKDLKKQLAETPDSWELVAKEAARQTVKIDGQTRPFPSAVEVPADRQLEFTVESRSEMNTVCVTGLPDPSTWKIGELRDGRFEPMGRRFPEEAGPQLNFDPVSGQWTLVLSLVFPGGTATRTFAVQPAGQ
ncbi:MAG: hypothetical protein ACO3PN_00505 [Chthoniobacterales bacterium]